MGSAYSYSPSGVEPGHHLSTFSVNGGGQPSTPTGVPTNGRYFTTSGNRHPADDPFVRNNAVAASLDRKLLQAQFPVSATVLSTRYAPDACTDDFRSGRGCGFVYQGCPSAATIQRAPSSPGSSRRNPVAVRPPHPGYHGNAVALAGVGSRLDDSASTTATDGTAVTSSCGGVGQYSLADVSDVLREDFDAAAVNPLIDRTSLSKGAPPAGFYGGSSVNCNTVNPEELCKEIDKLFFRA